MTEPPAHETVVLTQILARRRFWRWHCVTCRDGDDEYPERGMAEIDAADHRMDAEEGIL